MKISRCLGDFKNNKKSVTIQRRRWRQPCVGTTTVAAILCVVRNMFYFLCSKWFRVEAVVQHGSSCLRRQKQSCFCLVLLCVFHMFKCQCFLLVCVVQHSVAFVFWLFCLGANGKPDNNRGPFVGMEVEVAKKSVMSRDLDFPKRFQGKSGYRSRCPRSFHSAFQHWLWSPKQLQGGGYQS